MPAVLRSASFDKWLKRLRDIRGRAIILSRIERLASGNPGDVKPVGDGVSEMRIAFGPGYRVYYKDVGDVLILLLIGGDKSSQSADIEKARQIAKGWRP
jgi:putative addiction module killer protein